MTLPAMRARIARYRRAAPEDRGDFAVGCRVLTQPFLLAEEDWLPVPTSWSPNIVSFKTYSTGEVDGRKLWEALQGRILGTTPILIASVNVVEIGR